MAAQDQRPNIDFEQFFRAVSTPLIAFAIDDPDFTIIAENEAHAKIAFSEPKKSVGRPVFAVFPDTSEKFRLTGESDLLESFQKVIRTGKPDTMPILHYDIKDGSGKFVEKWWRVTHNPVFGADKKLAFIYQVTEDITTETQTAEKLALAKTQLDSALAIGLVSTWYWDIASDSVVGDSNLAKNFGVSPKLAAQGLPLRTFTDAIHSQDRSRVISAIQSSMVSGTDYEEEYRVTGSNGHERWVIARGQMQYDDHGQPLRFLGVNVDITERKKAEAKLGQITVMFNALFESKMLCIALARLDGTVIDANKTFLKTFGYTKLDLESGITSKQLTPLHARWITQKIYDALQESGEAEPIEKEYLRKDGSVIPMLVGAIMLPDDSQTFIAFMLDISENKELRALNKVKDEFIGMASHQLRTPATAVKQYLNLLQSGFGGELSQAQAKYVNKAYTSNERQLDIVNDLLKTAQLDAEHFELNKEVTSMSELIEGAVKELEETLNLRRQMLLVEGPFADKAVMVDSTELRLVLVNLIENASKYSPHGSNITISGSLVENYVAVSVTDRGVGIAGPDINRIFQKFTRVDNILSDTVSGTGLGLYWVERIIKLHDGHISVASEPGKGTTFTILLPPA